MVMPSQSYPARPSLAALQPRLPNPEEDLLTAWKDFEAEHKCRLLTPKQAGEENWALLIGGDVLRDARPDILLIKARQYVAAKTPQSGSH